MTLNKPARVNSGKSGETIANAILDEAVRAAVKLLRRFDRFYFRCVGEWLSLVEHLVRDQGVGGSNPLAPTILSAQHVGVLPAQQVPGWTGSAEWLAELFQ